MRTTIELSDDLISILHAIAVKKGYRGYSKVIEEALNFYLKESKKRESGRKKILRMRSSWSLTEAKETKKRLEEIRKNWKI
ncbi:MAG: ribbon-helix-helix protein, CopG family [Candidatus Aminicenantia bacterium]